MKLTKFLSLIVLLTVSLSVIGQEQSLTIKRIRIHDLFIQAGINGLDMADAPISDFKALAPQSLLWNTDLTDFFPSGSIIMKNRPMFSALVGFQFSDRQKSKYKTNSLLRLGISYFSGSKLTGGIFKADSKPFDTLTSSQTGQQLFIDSVSTRSYTMNYSAEQVRFDGSFIFSTNPIHNFSMFIGIGMTAGFSINANTNIYYDYYSNKQSNNGSVTYQDYYFEPEKSEHITNKMNYSVSVYAPMGFDFRLGKENIFWEKIHLFYELRPGVNFTSIPELRTMTNINLQQGLGIRVSVD